MSGGISSGQLRSFVERVERLNAEIAALNADKSEVLKEAAGTGFDKAALRAVVKRRAVDRAARQEHDAIVDLYERALEGAGAVVAATSGVTAGETAPSSGPEHPAIPEGANPPKRRPKRAAPAEPTKPPTSMVPPPPPPPDVARPPPPAGDPLDIPDFLRAG